MERTIEKRYIGSCCGNRFIIMDCTNLNLSNRFKSNFAKKYIPLYNVDSAIFLERSNGMDVFMRIFERDGSESDSCGNGTILTAYLLKLKEGRIEMIDNAAIIKSNSKKQAILMSIKFSEVKKVKNSNNCIYIKMGEPHLVYLVKNIKKFNLAKVGKEAQKKYPKGINVDVIQKIDDLHYLIKTYERGVFDETESCGTGSLSAYLAILNFNDKISNRPIEFISDGGKHWVSRDCNMLKLETLKSLCKIKSL